MLNSGASVSIYVFVIISVPFLKLNTFLLIVFRSLRPAFQCYILIENFSSFLLNKITITPYESSHDIHLLSFIRNTSCSLILFTACLRFLALPCWWYGWDALCLWKIIHSPSPVYSGLWIYQICPVFFDWIIILPSFPEPRRQHFLRQYLAQLRPGLTQVIRMPAMPSFGLIRFRIFSAPISSLSFASTTDK